jgi:hypothetical protein
VRSSVKHRNAGAHLRVASKKNNGHGVHKRAANDGKNEKPDCFLSIHADGVVK